MSEKALELISAFVTAISNCSLYSRDHPAVSQLSQKAVSIMENLYAEEILNISILGDSLVFNNTPLTKSSIHISNFIKRLRRKGVGSLIFKKGITQEELTAFIYDIVFSENLSNMHPHISSGILEVRLKAGESGISAAMEENVAKVKEVYQGVSRFKELDMVGLEDVVISFISTLKREANILNVLCPIKTYSEYTYTHNTNVAVLSVFQAESLGLSGEILHDIGLAGLLHDIGKMFVAREILEKDSRLDDAEWSEMKKHPAYGALYLARMSDIPKPAIIAAFEHHMRYDGRGYPDSARKERKQHIISQIISVSDFFDALRTERSYRKALDVPSIVGLLHESAGSNFNPELINNFVLALRKVGVLKTRTE